MTKPLRINPQVLAEASLDAMASSFVDAGVKARQPDVGMLEILAASSGSCPRVLLSAGVHGDETAPIELLAEVLSFIFADPLRLQVDLLIVIGNLDAIAQHKRYIDVDMNRLFHDGIELEKASREKIRAHAIMQTASHFFATPVQERLHLDLHTAIRASRYPSFAIVPSAIPQSGKHRLAAWLGTAGIGAVVMNNRPARTFSAFTADRFSAVSATVELGRVGRLGENDLSTILPMQKALEKLISLDELVLPEKGGPPIFEVSQEIIKHSNTFCMAFDASVENFASLHRGMEIARDGDQIYSVNAETEYILFPNPDVAVGQRAGLMLVKRASAPAV